MSNNHPLRPAIQYLSESRDADLKVLGKAHVEGADLSEYSAFVTRVNAFNLVLGHLDAEVNTEEDTFEEVVTLPDSAVISDPGAERAARLAAEAEVAATIAEKVAAAPKPRRRPGETQRKAILKWALEKKMTTGRGRLNPNIIEAYNEAHGTTYTL